MQISKELLADLAVGIAAGAVATWLSGLLQSALYRLTPQQAKRREEEVRPGSPTEVAAKKAGEAADVNLSKEQIGSAASAIHYAAGIPWGAAYTFLRRRSGMAPVGAALATGASMSLILDEALTPAMRFSAPDRDYPTATHLRGLVTHLLFGAVLGGAAELLYALSATMPPRGESGIA